MLLSVIRKFSIIFAIKFPQIERLEKFIGGDQAEMYPKETLNIGYFSSRLNVFIVPENSKLIREAMNSNGTESRT